MFIGEPKQWGHPLITAHYDYLLFAATSLTWGLPPADLTRLLWCGMSLMNPNL